MSLPAIVRRRCEALLLHHCDVSRMPLLVSVPTVHSLGQLTFLDEFEEDEEVLQLGRRATGSVVIRQSPGNPDTEASLWVASSYRGYRAAYRAFLKQVYDIDVPKAALGPYDVDHMLNRARSAGTATFLRVEAIPSGDNQTWGRVYEKAASQPGLPKNDQGYRYLSHTIAAKIAGLRPPSGPNDRQAIAAIEAEFRRRGMPRWALDQALDSMLGRDMRPR